MMEKILSKSSSSRSILLDPQHSLAFIFCLIEENLIRKDDSVAVNSLETVGDLVNARTRSLLRPTAQMKEDVRLLYSIYDEIKLFFPRNWFAEVDFSNLNRKITPYQELPQSEQNAWFHNDFSTVKAKAEIFAEYTKLSTNPASRASRKTLPFDKLFTESDLTDLDHLGELVWTHFNYHPIIDLIRGNGSEFIRHLNSDPESIHHVAKSLAKSRVFSQRDFMLLMSEFALGVRDTLSDIRAMIEIAGENRIEISSSRSVELPKTNPHVEFHTNSDSRIIIRALLEELKDIPVPINIEQSDRMYESSRMRKLWMKIEQWSAALKSGNLDVEVDIRSDLIAAIKENANANTRSRKAAWAGIVSLPIAVAEALLGAPPIGSLSVATVGAVINSQSQLAKWKNEWFIWN